MKVEILGIGCPRCRSTEKVVRRVVDELSMDVEIAKIERLDEIMERGVMLTPAVAVDGEIHITGRVPGEAELKALLQSRG